MKTNRQQLLIAMAVSLGGFLFGFDAAVISGVTNSVMVEFGLSDLQLGWVVACLTFASAAAMLTAGPLSDRFGRKNLLFLVGIFYGISALLSAVAVSYPMLVIARMIGGLAVGASLVLAPMYIAEISPPESRGKMVSIQQLNIVLGFSAAYFSNYYLLKISQMPADWVAMLGMDTQVWRWMLGIELIPALLFAIAMIWVPASPRWLMSKGKLAEAQKVLDSLYSPEASASEFAAINDYFSQGRRHVDWRMVFSKSLRLVLFIGLIVGILQQITGVNAIYFYATMIFEQSGIGKDAAFAQAIWIGIVNVVFTLLAMSLIDKIGRRPLLLAGVIGVVVSLSITAYGFSEATYRLEPADLSAIEGLTITPELTALSGETFSDDVAFKNTVREAVGEQAYAEHQGAIIASAIDMNPVLVLVGILGFVASFAVSLGPVMWVLLSELFPNWIRGVAISLIGFVNAVVSFLVQLLFPWELSHFGNAWSYLIFAGFGLIGLILLYRYLPETKGKSLEEIEETLVLKS
ncbi:sugar porter family MFS transporter [Pontibacter sp. G13]|uniref:sugar porter family MFS transporter n=1 Tax=Pontibacter sp. G13 TaxID=3074898 RepID=UPI00288C066C|nr:sugar porter family MFS transporter [Pontibacter sp. G13]WNJ16171.1 sugar porter family MFS transporter [Pontibacter sp. G13]